LHGARTVGDLGPKERDGDLRESLQEPVEEQRLGVHQGLDARELSGGTAFDQIAGDRERRPGESDERVFVASNSFTTRSTVWVT